MGYELLDLTSRTSPEASGTRSQVVIVAKICEILLTIDRRWTRPPATAKSAPSGQSRESAKQVWQEAFSVAEIESVQRYPVYPT